ncbi:dermonecrotic toxin domain-containing protein [Pseudomonas sp. LG1D9]|uniref:dermonecrotic toxin domain-containing protein n=1 Tax=Pseudomonas sp. LG1D9 TaxID=2083054 RepID=UPI00131A329A|nr:DUF6543 domain-containing protein [Pseudomonas sp. LG1D9]
MQIKTASATPWNHSANDQPTASNTGYRNKRSIDSSAQADQQLVQEVRPAPATQGGGYTEVSVDPSPGKDVENSQKVPPPIDVGLNINVDPVAKHISSAFKTVEQKASDFLKEKFAELKKKDPANKEKWDIDPDNTYLVTYDYNSVGEEPYPAKVIQRISLTQALIKNAQDTPTGKGYKIPFFAGGPNVKTQNSLPMNNPGIFDFSTRFSPYRKDADVTHTYQGIYVESSDAPSQTYNSTNQSSITPKEFKNLVWQADFQQPYTNFLDEFWSTHIEKYPVLAKASFVKSAMTQHQEGSLTTDGRKLIMRAAGLSGNQESWPDITYDDLQKNPPKDPNIEVGLLKIGEYQSTDLIYITDNKVTFDSDGKRIPPLTLLYIPGNSSPIHSFNSQAEMKKWLAEQMADPAKRNALASHFKLEDKPNGWKRAGLDETLIGLGTWPETRETPGGILSYDHRAFSGKWDPEKFITTEPNNLPFQEVTKRQKDRSYADAAVKITSDRDETKKNIIEGLTKTSKIALFLTPLAFVVPEVALALDTFYLASGGVTASIGVDDNLHNKAKGTDRIVFGLFNAATVAIPKVIGKAREQSIGEFKAPEETASPPDQEPPQPAENPDNGVIGTDIASETGPVTVVQMGGPMNELKYVSNEVHTYVDIYKSGKRLNIVAHGSKPSWADKFLGNGSQVVIDGKGYTPQKLVALLKEKGIDPERYDSVRLIMCHSAEGRGNSFAAKFQKEINKPVKAYDGTVSLSFGSTAMKKIRDQVVTQIMQSDPTISLENAENLAEIKLQDALNGYAVPELKKANGQLVKINTAPAGDPPKYEVVRIEYKPVHFPKTGS